MDHAGADEVERRAITQRFLDDGTNSAVQEVICLSAVIWSIIFGLLGNALGFIGVLALDQPLGPVLVLVTGVITLLTYLVPGGTLDALTPSRPGDRPARVPRFPAQCLRQH